MLATLRRDLRLERERDPVARSSIEIAICHSGVDAIWTHRISHYLWHKDLKLLARTCVSVARMVTRSTSILMLCSARACSSMALARDLDLVWREARAGASPRPVVRRRPVRYTFLTSGTTVKTSGGDALQRLKCASGNT
jgi:hypothetical protein